MILLLSLQEWIVATRVDSQDAFNVLKEALGARDPGSLKSPPPLNLLKEIQDIFFSALTRANFRPSLYNASWLAAICKMLCGFFLFCFSCKS